jgi:hypothetical protein
VEGQFLERRDDFLGGGIKKGHLWKENDFLER